jgi:Carbohydrate-binding module 48 (Isoamylase N-terminal domain)
MSERESLDPYVEWIVAEARRPVVIDAAARQRLMEAIRSEPAPQRRGRMLAWLLEPRHIALPPIAAAALAAGLVGIGILGGSAINRDGRSAIGRPSQDGVAHASRLPDSSVSVVKFVLTAPKAQSVAVLGDFNDWDAAATPAVREQDGTWTMYVPLRPGRYEYTFMLDGRHLVPDPAAPIGPDDGYGQKNSVVVVAGAVS